MTTLFDASSLNDDTLYFGIPKALLCLYEHCHRVDAAHFHGNYTRLRRVRGVAQVATVHDSLPLLMDRRGSPIRFRDVHRDEMVNI